MLIADDINVHHARSFALSKSHVKLNAVAIEHGLFDGDLGVVVALHHVLIGQLRFDHLHGRLFERLTDGQPCVTQTFF